MRPASSGRKPETRSKIVVLPAPFGPIMPDDLALVDVERGAVDGADAAEPSHEAVDGQRHRPCAEAAVRPCVDGLLGRRRRAGARPLEEDRPQQVGPREQVGRRSAEADRAALHEVGPLGDGERDVHALLDEDDGDAGGGEALDDRQQLPDDQRRQPERELVDQQHPRPG